MTISTEQTQIAVISLPIAEATRPCPSSFEFFDFSSAVDVVNIQRAKIRETALNTFSAKRIDNFKLTRPVARMFVPSWAVEIPIKFRAFARTKLRLARFAAFAAFSRTAPACRQITALTAIFSRAVSQTIRVHFGGCTAVSADDFDWGRALSSHIESISQYTAPAKPKYFDIACRRISEALKQPDMFIEKPKPAVQDALIF